ncbi:hypothetical protein BH09BAC5_BH09BAC5_14250 [soil metagenome]
MRRINILLVLLFPVFLNAQKDSVIYNSDFRFKEGIYLNYENFRMNKPIPKSAIISDYDHSEIDFVRKIVSTKSILYKDSAGIDREISPSKLWGFCENNSVYIRWNGDFNKIVVMGSLCHFTAMYTTYLSSSPTSPTVANTGAPVESVQQYVLDIQTGRVLDFILQNMETLYKRDDVLYKEFMAMKKGKRRKMMFYYLRKYNDAHPLYIGK